MKCNRFGYGTVNVSAWNRLKSQKSIEKLLCVDREQRIYDERFDGDYKDWLG